jgi:hypothetical protein
MLTFNVLKCSTVTAVPASWDCADCGKNARILQQNRLELVFGENSPLKLYLFTPLAQFIGVETLYHRYVCFARIVIFEPIKNLLDLKHFSDFKAKPAQQAYFIKLQTWSMLGVSGKS